MSNCMAEIHSAEITLRNFNFLRHIFFAKFLKKCFLFLVSDKNTDKLRKQQFENVWK